MNAIPQDDALHLQLAAIAGNDPSTSFYELRFRRARGMGQAFIPIREVERAAAGIRNRGQSADLYVGAAPRTERSGKADAIKRVWCLWADCDSETAVTALEMFRPQPSLLFRSGTNSNLHAWWPLSEPLPPSFARRANVRLAAALGADRAACDVARVLRPCTTYNHKHAPPRPVECVRLELDTFRAPEIVGQLPDEPRPASRPSLRLVADPRARTAIVEGAVRVVREAPKGERNTKLNWAAYKLGQRVTAGTLDAAEVERELQQAASAAGLPENEADRTIRSGLNAAGAA